MHFQSVTFDLDGTLLDTIADLAEACRLMLEEIGEPPRSQTEVHSFVGKGMAVLVERCLTHRQPPSAERLHQAIESFKRHYAAVNGKSAQIYPGVLEGLQAWKASGLKMGVVTNKPGMFTEALLDRMGLSDYFDVIVSGDTTAHKKPHPEPILHACRLFNVSPTATCISATRKMTSTAPMPPAVWPMPCPMATTRASRWTVQIAMR